MSNVIKASQTQAHSSEQSVEAQAMRWLLEIKSTDPGLDRWLALGAWLSENPDHEAVYSRFEETLARLQQQCLERQEQAVYSRVRVAGSRSAAPVGATRRAEGFPRDLIGELRSRARHQTLLIAGSFAALVAGIFSIAYLYLLYPETKQATLADTTIATTVYSKRSMLDNGVSVRLAAHTMLQVEFSEEHHRVRLLAGKASFDVPANLTQPFEVSTDLVKASTSVSAQFTVEIDRGVWLRVKEGDIQVSPAGVGRPITLKRGAIYRVYSEGLPVAVAKLAPIRVEHLSVGQTGRDGLPIALRDAVTSSAIALSTSVDAHTQVIGCAESACCQGHGSKST